MEKVYDEEVFKLGLRAVRYYVDTGLCVFCEADDCANISHEDHCNVGKIAAVENTPERRAEKAEQRRIVDQALTELWRRGGLK